MNKLVFALAALAATSSFAQILGENVVRAYVDRFNGNDEQLYTNAIGNAAASGFLIDNVPRFECPDADIERTYYFRWWTYRKHLRKVKGEGTWVVSEFMPEVGWAGAENTISCPFGHHVREGRWLRDPQYLDGYIDFMLRKGRISGPGSYASWPAWTSLERAKVTGDFAFLESHLDGFVRNFETWQRGWPVRSYSLKRIENRQDAKTVEIRCGFRPERGLFDIAGDREGSEFALSDDGARPLINAAMWGEATAIAEIARRAGRTALAERFAQMSADLERNVKAKLWNADKRFFTTLSVAGGLDDVCELHGYAPFYFGMDLRGFEAAWKPLTETGGFLSSRGLTFPTRDTPGFDLTFDIRRHECMWNGPSWPYATSIALTALYEMLQKGARVPVTAADFAKLLHQYAAQQVRTLPDGRTVPWIDEDLDPVTGEWLARRHLIEWDRQGFRKLSYLERGKDYNHSTFCDLVLAGLCGFVPQADGQIVVKPLAPAEWNWWCADGIRSHGHDVTVLFDRDGSRYGKGCGLVVLLDGREFALKQEERTR